MVHYSTIYNTPWPEGTTFEARGEAFETFDDAAAFEAHRGAMSPVVVRQPGAAPISVTVEGWPFPGDLRSWT
jgi:hypothetical protein